jgi:hypothetical protein
MELYFDGNYVYIDKIIIIMLYIGNKLFFKGRNNGDIFCAVFPLFDVDRCLMKILNSECFFTLFLGSMFLEEPPTIQFCMWVLSFLRVLRLIFTKYWLLGGQIRSCYRWDLEFFYCVWLMFVIWFPFFVWLFGGRSPWIFLEGSTIILI